MSLPAAWLVHTVTAEPYLGRSGNGIESYGSPVTVTCFVEARSRHVRAQQDNNSTGDEVLSTATLYAQLGALSSFPAKTRVTLPAVLGGRQTWVIENAPRDGGSLPVPSHLEVMLA